LAKLYTCIDTKYLPLICEGNDAYIEIKHLTFSERLHRIANIFVHDSILPEFQVNLCQQDMYPILCGNPSVGKGFRADFIDGSNYVRHLDFFSHNLLIINMSCLDNIRLVFKNIDKSLNNRMVRVTITHYNIIMH
jgi:hypothetical protein